MINNDVEKFKEVFSEIEQKLFKNLDFWLNSETVLLDMLMYYDDICLQKEIVQSMEEEIDKHLSSFSVEIFKSQLDKLCSRERRNRNLINSLEIIFKKNIEKVNINSLKTEEIIFNNSRKKIYSKNSKIINYYDLFIARYSVGSNRYKVKLNDEKNVFELINNEYNYKFNIQGYLEAYQSANVEVNNDILDNDMKFSNLDESIDTLIPKIYKMFCRKFQSLLEDDYLGKYRVKDVVGIWSIIFYFACDRYCIKYVSGMSRLGKYVDRHSKKITNMKLGSKDMFSYLQHGVDFCLNEIVGKNKDFNEIEIIQIEKLQKLAFEYFGIEYSLVDVIVNDFIYKDKQKSFSIQEYPFIKIGNGIAFSSFYIKNEINLELLIKKKSKKMYKQNYDKLHTLFIEPRICKKIKSQLEQNKNFNVYTLSDTIKLENTNIQSQIDVLVYDIKKKDIMIIEVKDHIEKIDYVDVQTQVRFEANIKGKKNAIAQLEKQSMLIKHQYNFSKYIKEININDVNNIYLGYCETCYMGTPKFLNELREKSIAFMQYNIFNHYLYSRKFNSIEDMFSFFYNMEYLKDYKFNNSTFTIKENKYTFLIPGFTHID